MGKMRRRLDPEEVKQMLEAEKPKLPDAPFHSPFADARQKLEALRVKKTPGVKVRRPSTEEEPSVLAKARAQHRAARDALAASVKPMVRKRPDEK